MTLPEHKDLGQTHHLPTLFPGDPGVPRQLAATLTDLASSLSESGDEVKRAGAPSWSGEAADAFVEAKDPIPGWWYQASDELSQCATVVGTYADTLEAGLRTAQDAMDLWDTSRRMHANAEARYHAEVREYNESVANGIIPMQYPVLADDGFYEEREAKAMLSDARSAVDKAGTDALMAMVRLTGGMVSSGGAEGPGSEGSWSWGGATSDQWKDQWGDEGWSNGFKSQAPLGLSAVLASAHGAAWVWRAQGSFVRPVGWMNGQIYGNGSVSALSAQATGGISFDPSKGFVANASASAELIGVDGAIGYRTDYSDVSLSGNAGVGLYAEGDAVFTQDGVELGGEVFAGAKAEGEASISLGGIGISASGEAWAGAGAAASGGITWSDGKLVIDETFGLAWGVGGSESLAITLDFPEMGRTATALWDNLWD